MQISSKLFFFVLSAAFAANTAIAAPLSTSGMAGTADANDLLSGADMADDFSISDLKKALTKAAATVKQIATVAKPIVDTVAKVASVTPIGPEVNILDKAVNAATHLPGA